MNNDLLKAAEDALEQITIHTESMSETEFQSGPWYKVWNQLNDAVGAEKHRRRITQKEFKVVARTIKCNSFGLRGHVMVARDGEAWEVGRSDFGGNEPWLDGDTVAVPLNPDGTPNWAAMHCEIPHRKPDAPAAVLKEVFGS